jgi:hypothetical protein
MRSRVVFALALLASALSGRVFAQPSGGVSSGPAFAPPPSKEMPEFGTTGASSVRLTALDFFPIDDAAYASATGGFGRYPLGGQNALFAPVHVPGGTKITRIELDYCDTSVSDKHVSLSLLQCDNQGQNCLNQAAPVVSSSNDCLFVAESGLAIQVNNYSQQYVLEAVFQAQDGTNVLTGAIISYQLQVSQAPGTATFNDVPTNHPFFQYIEALSASGITGGCGAGNYCPDAPLTRGQMAVFLAKALGLYWVNQ